MACQICETRRPRRFCPGVRGDICSPCCGAEREMTVDCPLDCEFLVEARRHEKPAPINPETVPNRDIPVTDRFLQEKERVVIFVGGQLARAALMTPGVVDADVREALDALVRTYRTLESGVLYETRPTNPLAAGVCEGVQEGIASFRRMAQERAGGPHLRDIDLLGVLAFLQRLEYDRNNGRKRGRAFLHLLTTWFPPELEAEAPAASPLIVP